MHAILAGSESEFVQPPRNNPAASATVAVPHSIYAIAVLAIAVRMVVAFATHFTSEDYLITLRFAENLAHGHGLVYNVGERVLGTTTPLYALFLGALSWIGLPATLGGKAVNILSDGALCVLAYRLVQCVREEPAGWIAAFWIAISPLHIQWSISGMETSLVTACGMWVWVAYLERRNTTAYMAAAVLLLLRWEGILVFVILTAANCIRDRRLPLREILLFSLLIAPWVVAATLYYGNPIPVTAIAKSTVYGWRAQWDITWLRRTFPGILKLAERFILSPGYAMMTLFAVLGMVRACRLRYTMLAAPGLWFGIYWLAFLFSRVLLFSWYLVPAMPIYEIFAALGLAAVFERINARFPHTIVLPAVAAVASVLAIGCSYAAIIMCRDAQAIEDRVRIPIALWLKSHSRPTDIVMLEPIGYIGYYSERPVLDIVGLVSPKVLEFYRSQNQAPVLEIARVFRPEWCVLRPGEIDRIRRVADAQNRPWEVDYELVQIFSLAPRSNVYYIFRRR